MTPMKRIPAHFASRLKRGDQTRIQFVVPPLKEEEQTPPAPVEEEKQEEQPETPQTAEISPAEDEAAESTGTEEKAEAEAQEPTIYPEENTPAQVME